MEKIYLVVFEWSVEDGYDTEVFPFMSYKQAYKKFKEKIEEETQDDSGWVHDAITKKGTAKKGYTLETNDNDDPNEEIELYWSFTNDNFFEYHSNIYLRIANTLDDLTIGKCACCKKTITATEYYTRIDGALHCDYCSGEDGLTASEIKRLKEQEQREKEAVISYDKLFETAYNAIIELENSEYEFEAILERLDLTVKEYRFIKEIFE